MNRTLKDFILKDKGSIISGPFGSEIGKKFFVKKGIPVIRGNNLTEINEFFIDDGFVFVTEEKAQALNAYAIENDLIFTAAGTIGQVGLIPSASKYKKYVISNKQIRVRLDTQKISPKFAYLWCNSSWINLFLKRHDTGSTVPLINLSVIREIPIKEIDILMQEKIVKILDDINSKILTNNKINAELEKMAKLLYYYWFVQFDFPYENGKPYRTSGGAMVYNKTLKREIPVGWKVKRLSEILSINRKCFNGEKANLYGIDLSVMPSKTMCINDRSKAENFDTNQFVMKKYDILFGSIRPYLYKAGFAPFDGVVNGTVHSFSSKKINDYSFALMTIVSDMMFSYAITRSGGTKMPIIKADDLLEYCVAVDEETAIKYHEKVRSYWELIAKNIQQNFELSDLRDFLLPLLMTGQVKVK